MASARAGTVIASATVWPDAGPPTARTTTHEVVKITAVGQ
jgi:hypothetical protein